MSKSTKRIIFDYLLIIIGTTIMAFGINFFYDPNTLIVGGVTGVAIIIANFSDRIGLTIPLWLTNIVLNIPLFILAMKSMGKRFLIRTLFATLYLSVALFYTALIPVPTNQDLVLAAVFGGVLAGVGSALVFKPMATTGGSDMLAFIIHHKMKHVSLSRILFVVDGAIILMGLLAFGMIRTMYAIIAVYVTTKVIDTILEGLDFAKAAWIISNESEIIAEKLMHELDRGVTALNGRGMYTHESKNVLLCVVSSKELPQLKEIVYACDSNAFVIMSDVREVVGEGFKQEEHEPATSKVH
jgi:uncharacterized membrane-anchored protein YitT (DUF2179 family)